MLSLSAMRGGNEDYYLSLATEDYYLEGGEPPGRWLGRGSKLLGLEGQVGREQLRSLFRGRHPDGAPLVQNAGQRERQPGWDLTFSAPKSVSVLWSQATLELRRAIEAAHHAAIQSALAYLEDEVAFSRVGRGGQQQVPVALVVARFDHGTSRALDPQLHSHCLVLNVGVDEQGVTRTILSKPLYQHKMAAGALYRAELACQLGSLGLEIVREGSWFELAAVPKKLRELFSTRRKEIEAALNSAGLESASAAAFAALETRTVKELIPPRAELFTLWKESAKDFPLSIFPRRTQRKHSASSRQQAKLDALESALRTLSDCVSHFAAKDVIRELAREACYRGLSAHDVRQTLAGARGNSNYLISLGSGVAERFTTPEILATEQRLLAAATSLAASPFQRASDSVVQRAIEKKRLPNERPTSVPVKLLARRIQRATSRQAYRLSAEQATALSYLTQGTGRLKILSGYAGTGKTALLQAVREVLEKQGYRVLGCALSGMAAKKLMEGSGIESETLRKTLHRLGPTMGEIWKHHLSQLLRAARKKPTYHFDRLVLDSNTVVVLDEAAMVGTKDLERLVSAVQQANAILILSGDAGQLPSISAGGGFESLARRWGCSTLREITRQRDTADRAAVKAFAEGRAAEALLNYARKGQLVVADNHASQENCLIEDWSSAGGIDAPREHCIFAATHDEVHRLNARCQRARRIHRQLESARTIRIGGTKFHVGDRVLCLKNSRPLQLKNGQTGTLVAIHGIWRFAKVVVRLDGSDSLRTIPIGDYDHLMLGYAFTTHKLQGATVENAYVQLSGKMNYREMTYVQASRHRNTLRLYTNRNEIGDRLHALVNDTAAKGTGASLGAMAGSPLVAKMGVSTRKQLAHEIASQMDETAQPLPRIQNL